MNGFRSFFLFLIFKNSFESAVENHSQRTTSFNIRAVTLKTMDWVGEPGLALFLAKYPICERFKSGEEDLD